MAYTLSIQIAALSFFAFTVYQARGDCQTTSDLGLTECVIFSEYSDYQWSTCLTDDYIKRASAAIGKTYHC
eukprot:m.140390 g.140390  ORF g.140390 m.140390 type:complete len:71 (+) comp38302_c0_seq1:51-263(+)